MSKGEDLRDLFRQYQAEMDKGLSKCRTIKHSTTQGDETEACWSKWFSDSLPARYQVKKGIVIDCNGYMSDQIDIIVFDQHYSPFMFKGKLSVYIPAESVYAVFEVKTNINKHNMEYAGRKVASVRRLRRTNAPIVHAGGKIVSPKAPFNILGGILSYDVEWKIPYGPAFSKIMESQSIDERLDIGCSIAKGAFEARYGSEGMDLVAESEDSLIFFLLRLLSRLQELGTVPAIDLNEYLRLIKSQNRMPGSSSNRDVWLVTKELTAETGFDRVMVEGKEPKKYVVYYRIDGKPQGLTKRWFVIESLVGFLIIASTFVLYKFTLALIVLCFVTPFWLLWWGIGRYNANKLERGSR